MLPSGTKLLVLVGTNWFQGNNLKYSTVKVNELNRKNDINFILIFYQKSIQRLYQTPFKLNILKAKNFILKTKKK